MKLNKQSKERIQFFASLAMLVAGIVLIFVALILEPVGVIHYSVLTAFGMLLTFVGAVWQIDVKYTFKTQELRNELFIRNKGRHYNSMRRNYGYGPDPDTEDYGYEEDEDMEDDLDEDQG